MKQNKSILALPLFAIVLVMTALFVAPRSETVASAQDTYPTFPTPLPTSVPGFIEQKLQPYAQSDISVQTVNGVEMAAANFRIEEGEFRADVCFQTPDGNDWGTHQVIARFGEVELVPYGGTTFEKVQTLMDGKRYFTSSEIFPHVEIPIDGTPDYRCDTHKFRIPTDVSFSTDYVVLTVYAIGGTPNEGAGCATREAMQSILDDKDLGIKIACNQTESGTKTEILEKPQTMSEEEARQHIAEAFQQMFVREGPWVFEGIVTTTP